MQQAAEQPLNRSNAVKNHGTEKYRMMQEESKWQKQTLQA